MRKISQRSFDGFVLNIFTQFFFYVFKCSTTVDKANDLGMPTNLLVSYLSMYIIQKRSLIFDGVSI